MKIEQDPKTGKINFKLDAGEVYDINEYVRALIDFVSAQAIETFRHTQEYRRMVIVWIN